MTSVVEIRTTITVLKKDGMWGYQVFDGEILHPFRTVEDPDGTDRCRQRVVTLCQKLRKTGFLARIIYHSYK